MEHTLVWYVWLYDREKVSTATGMVDEKLTVISIFPEIAHFFGTEAGVALACLGN
jgi:hypothetical protein